MADSSAVRTGTLVRDTGSFVLRGDDGTRYSLHLQRVPVDLVEKRVRVTGELVAPDQIVAEGVAPE